MADPTPMENPAAETAVTDAAATETADTDAAATETADAEIAVTDAAADSRAARLPAEDLPVGREIDCGSHEVTESELVAFASTWDPQYFHVDRERAAQSDFGGLIASGLHTASIFQRLAVTGIYRKYDVVAGKEITNLRFLRPVRPGDVLSCGVTVRSVEPSGSGRCLVTMAGVLRNQNGKHVLELEVDSLIRSRG